MKKSHRVIKLLQAGYAAFHALGMSSGMALGDPVPEPPKSASLASEISSSSSGENTSQSANFISQGQVYEMKDLGIKLTPPSGWEVSPITSGLSLVMKEQRDPAPAFDAPKYQRNITLAVTHGPSPIDEKRAKELEAQLSQNFGQEGSAQDFKILEHKFFDHKGTGDGLIVYSSLNIGGYPMMQMHVLLGGANKQYLFTYTDLASRFDSSASGAYQAAWTSIVGAEIDGQAPSRLALYRPHIIAGCLISIICGLIAFLRLRALRKDYKSEADFMFDSEDESMKGLDHSGMTSRRTAPRRSKNRHSHYSGFSSFSSLAAVPLSSHSVEFASQV